MQRFFYLLILLGCSLGVMAQSVVISELHYDNEGADTGESVEITGPAGTDLSGWSVVFYNGNGGAPYATLNLGGTFADEGNGYGALCFSQSGIQNGGPDGLALVDNNGTLVEFLSYEGSFAGVGGPADGVTSTNIGVSETGSTPTGQSLQRTGLTSWAGPDAENCGTTDAGLVAELPPVGGGGGGMAGSAVVISELHYDNTGSDIDENVEITGPAGTSLDGWSVVFYNGNGGASYATLNLSGTFADQGDGYGALCFAQSGIQNGAPDGLALVDDNGVVVEFLSYEGSFTAVGGPADGITSTDIGVSEATGTPVGQSLQRGGLSTWAFPSTANCGTVDAGLVAELPPVDDNGGGGGGGDDDDDDTPVVGLPYMEMFETGGFGVTGECSDASIGSCATVNLDGVDWTVEGDFSGLVATSDLFLTNGTFQNLEARDLDAEICWVSPIVDISGVDQATFSVDLAEFGTSESTDYVDVFLIVDGVETRIPNWEGLGSSAHTLIDDYSSVTVTATDIEGDAVQIRICVLNNAGSEFTTIDNVSVKEQLPEPCAITLDAHSFSGCQDNGTIYADDDFFTATITVTVANRPESGTIDFTGDFVEAIPSIDVATLDPDEDSFPVQVKFRSSGAMVEFTATASADLFCTATEMIAAPAPCSTIDPCTQLFFSEIVEGSGFNKCVEIYNPTDATVDLTGYTIELYSNGNTAPNSITPLTGSIEPGGVYVVCNPAAGAEFIFLSDQLGEAVNYNGDDAFTLTDGTGIIDAYGQIGVQTPYGNQNNTLRRSYGVSVGDNNPFDAFTPDEFEVFPINESFGLGYHATDCQPGLANGLQEIDDCGGGVAQSDGDDVLITTNCILSTGPTVQGMGTGAYDRICGDFVASTRVELSSSSSQTGAGLIIRANSTPGSPFYAIYLEGSGRNRILYRTSQNGSVRTRSLSSRDEYVRIERDGRYLRLYTSRNGSSWRRRYSVRPSSSAFDDCALVGAIAFRRTVGATFTATFSELDLGGSANSALAAPETPLAQGADLTVAPEATTAYSTPVDLAAAPLASGVTELRIWPNPVRSEFTLELPAAATDRTLLITDLTGRTLQQTVLPAGTERQSLWLANDLPAGIYLLRIPSEGGVITQRLVKVD
jgi:hypothetical protein